MRTKLLVGNWKMNGSTAFIADLLTELKISVNNIQSSFGMVVCPPAAYLSYVRTLTKGSKIALGAQTLSEKEEGAYTGEISATMLKDLGCTYVIVGHSERRQYYFESDTHISQKFMQAKKHGLIPILCVGETQDQRQNGLTNTVIAAQLKAISNASESAFSGAVIAYEPVWAIGTGLSATPAEIDKVHQFIREQVAIHQPTVAKTVQILYGGSVKPSNAADIFALQNVDGGLIGGASLKASEFLSIFKSFK